MCSQIEISVQSPYDPTKLYKVKLFRNGRVQVPGGLRPDMSDVKYAIHEVMKMVSKCFNEELTLTDLYSIMRNYKFRLVDEDSRVNLKLLRIKFDEHKDAQSKIIADGGELVDEPCITVTKHNTERYPGLIVKFVKSENGEPKKTTINMSYRGKVNINGAYSEASAAFYYKWLSGFYQKHANDVIYTITPVVESSSEDSSSTDEAPPVDNNTPEIADVGIGAI